MIKVSCLWSLIYSVLSDRIPYLRWLSLVTSTLIFWQIISKILANFYNNCKFSHVKDQKLAFFWKLCWIKTCHFPWIQNTSIAHNLKKKYNVTQHSTLTLWWYRLLALLDSSGLWQPVQKLSPSVWYMCRTRHSSLHLPTLSPCIPSTTIQTPVRVSWCTLKIKKVK